MPRRPRGQSDRHLVFIAETAQTSWSFLDDNKVVVILCPRFYILFYISMGGLSPVLSHPACDLRAVSSMHRLQVSWQWPCCGVLCLVHQDLLHVVPHVVPPLGSGANHRLLQIESN